MTARSPLLTTALRGTPVIALLALSLGPLTAAPAAAATGQITGLAGKCLDVAGAGTADGTPVQLYDCNGTGAQQWTTGADHTLRALGKCLDVTGNSTADGAKVQLWSCTGAANQQWTVSAAHDIVNPAADKCLDVTDRSSANGARIQIWTCTGATNQKWNAPAQQTGEQCWATHYGPQPPGALTASGEVFDNTADTAATSLSRQPQLPFGTRVQVTNVANGRSLTVRINDRGTFAQTPQEPKCLDLTDGAFSRLGGVLDPDAGHIVVTQQVLG
ncbi:ricin-type beta-trefoil lectin domain protein [Streptomyces sp. NPDC048663]|uniref:ricin-type beta-trefoil lectin domain protein n=1 Tax=Streptomyces sp. NPDC048663 TaxID=3155638 RepID=UPI0034452D76